jgi:signal transduction histidine kinase
VPPVRAHPTRFRQALTNLIENAIVHSGGPAPRVQVESYVERERVAIVVADDGRGVDEAARPHLFELFTHGAQADAASRRSGSVGKGLGLALVKKIAEASGGSIAYEPGADGGSRFVLSLPRGAAN